MRLALRDWEMFARSLPHELSGPLLKIEAFAAFLLQGEAAAFSERGRRYMQVIWREAAHARSLAQAALALAPVPLESMRRERVDLSSLVWQEVDLLRERDPSRAVEISVQPGMSVPGDEGLLRLLLSNLLGNAWKFSASRLLAHIGVRTVVVDGQQAFCVGDDGVGFDMQHASRLFTPFGRLHSAAEFSGSGLGLLIARQVVERHGGRIWAEAGEDRGARFYFTLGSGTSPEAD